MNEALEKTLSCSTLVGSLGVFFLKKTMKGEEWMIS